MEKFVVGAVLGMVGGALIVANSQKARTIIKKSQDDFMQKVEKYIDSKFESMTNNDTTSVNSEKSENSQEENTSETKNKASSKKSKE